MNQNCIKVFLTAAVMSFMPVAVLAAPDPNFHIYLMLGQSNMEGSAPIESQDRTAHPRVQVLQSENCSGNSTPYGSWRAATPPLIRCGSGGGLGPGDTFGKAMADGSGDTIKIGLAGGAYGGAKIEYFLKNCGSNCTPPYGAISGAPNGGTGGYQWVIDLAKKAQQVGVIKGFIFHQGESNSGQQNWPTLVNQFVTDLRTDLGLNANDVPFIAGELPYTGCCSGHNSLVRQIPNVVANGHFVTADGGLNDKGDALHWNSAAVREMGRRYATKMLAVGSFAPPDCGSQGGFPICCSISADPDGDGMGTQNNNQACVVTEATQGWHEPNPADVVAAINVGGSGDAVSFAGIWYDADQYFTGGTANSTADVVSGANGSAVYSTERYGSFTYKIPVPNGDYSVQLGMVELYQTSAGARSFSVDLEDSTVVDTLDIFAQAGHDKVIISDSFVTSVYDGSIDINVKTLVDNGTLSSILVRKASAPVSSSSASVSSSSSSSFSSSSSSSANSSSGSGAVAGGSLTWSLILMMLLLGRSVAARRVLCYRG